MTTVETLRLTAYSHGAGCACKLGEADLLEVLRPLGLDAGDDAAVWPLDERRALIATVDFFTPIVDDARDWGRIAAANAASDVYAMGGTPMFALNVAGWPRDQLPLSMLTEVLAGAADVAASGGWVVVGGHTIDSVEPLFGQAVVGEVEHAALTHLGGGHAGQALVLTKAIGTGLITTAVKRSPLGALDPELREAYDGALASMTCLNDRAAAAAREAGATAATDVTGFGLVGHLHRLAATSGVAATVDADAVPLLPHVAELFAAGAIAGGTRRNVAAARAHIAGRDDAGTLTLLCDAQTSGGLLFACDPDAGQAAARSLCADGHDAAVIGRLHDGEPGAITIA